MICWPENTNVASGRGPRATYLSESSTHHSIHMHVDMYVSLIPFKIALSYPSPQMQFKPVHVEKLVDFFSFYQDWMGIDELLQISRISVYQSPSISTGLFNIFFYYLLVWTIKNLYDGKTELVLFRSRIYIYLCNRIGLGHPLNHRKTITLHLGMPGTLDSCPSIPSFLDH